MSKATPPKLGFSKKAQDAGQAATLIAIIALLIIFYLLFIPPSFRDQILEGNGTTTSAGAKGADSEVGEALLKASPGTLTPLSAEEVEHNIPSVTLYSKKKSETLGVQSAIEVKSSIFAAKKGILGFKVDDADNTENILLSFVDQTHKGQLMIRLNGNEVFSGSINQENPEPVRLNPQYVQRGPNTIEFEAAHPGLAFWRVNKHELRNVQVTGDVKDISQQQSRNIFIVTGTEKANVKRAILRFTPECVQGRVGKLNVLVNQHSVYYSVPDCGGRAVIEFTPDMLREGENSIVFDSEEGSYLVDLIRITSELKEVIQPAYYFELTESTLEDVRDGKYNLVLKLTFTEGSEMKSGKLVINGRETSIYQRERTYEKNINDYVIDGNNAIKLTPDTTLEVVNMEVIKE
ncbi:hypothetical protein KY362_04720 [Candidatus Woesearchaeota archaeon]|nr:hypothetical protein [Candidatus Woesearchaeota archaeon]